MDLYRFVLPYAPRVSDHDVMQVRRLKKLVGNTRQRYVGGRWVNAGDGRADESREGLAL